MTIKPEGLKLPDCECFNDKVELQARQNILDKAAALCTQEILDVFYGLNYCDQSKDYFYAAFIFQMVVGCCPVFGNQSRKLSKDEYKKTMRLANHRVEIEEAYDRLKPLIMQRIDYIDGLADILVGK